MTEPSGVLVPPASPCFFFLRVPPVAAFLMDDSQLLPRTLPLPLPFFSDPAVLMVGDEVLAGACVLWDVL
jgi:hypothetical protein